MRRPIPAALSPEALQISFVIPDGAQRRAGTQLSAHACVAKWVPALAALGRDDKRKRGRQADSQIVGLQGIGTTR